MSDSFPFIFPQITVDFVEVRLLHNTTPQTPKLTAVSPHRSTAPTAT